MEVAKKGLMSKAWGKCKSLSLSKSKSSNAATSLGYYLKRSFTTGDGARKKSQVAPYGCFSVYVGPEKRRFVVRAEFANHALFKELLDEAEAEFGHAGDGPIVLPCGVGLFTRVLAEMESGDDEDGDGFAARASPGCSLIACSPLHSSAASYSRISHSRLLKMNL